MELYYHPVRGQKNKFVVTEEEAYFVPLGPHADTPSFMDILSEVFDLDDSEVKKALEEKLGDGKVILGYLGKEGDLDVHSPLDPGEYVEERLEEVLEGT